MSFKELSSDERKNLQIIFDDLKKLFDKEEILASELDEFIGNLQSSEVKSYISSLRQGAKAEPALREAFFAGQSLLSRYLASEMSPEVNTGNGFVDYKIRSDSRFVMLELKPLFEAETRDSKSGRKLVKLKASRLKWNKHESQILKYLKTGGEFVVLTDLRDWYFFDDTATKENCKPFAEVDFLSLEKDFAMVENFYRVIERYKYTSLGENLDKVFFEDLKLWVKKLLEIEFDVDEKKKIQVVLGIINKFIFIQTLDDHSIVDFRWIQKTWDYSEQRWGSRGHFETLRQFYDDTVNWFFKFYDTELFVDNEIKFLKKDNDNVNKFYNNLKSILGITYLESDIGGQRGIMQYKFRFIDEDIFGKAYETFLGEVRHDEGVYYTPKYITQHIVENTISSLFDDKISEIKNSLKKEDFNNAEKQILELTKIKILDPACGSGSFLIKAIREIWKRYREIVTEIESLLQQNDVFDTLTRNPKIEEKVTKIRHLKDVLGFQSNRELISRLLLRHIHGNDLDPRAVAVAKVNVWLSAVKLSPRDFRYDKLHPDTNRVLPHLEMNIVNGDAVVGLPDKNVIDFLASKHKEDISNLSKLRNSYLEKPSDPELVNKITEQKKKLRTELLNEFSEYLKNNDISKTIPDLTIPHFWPLEFWYMYFEDSTPLPETDRGADCVVGNPPYERIQVLKKKSPDYVLFLDKAEFKSSTKNYDLAVIFTEKGYNLLRNEGEFGYIVTNKFIQGDYGEGLRTLLSEDKAVKEIVDFGDQQVFNESTTYTTLVFLKNKKMDTMKYCLVKKLSGNIEQMHEIRDNASLDNSNLTIFPFENEKLTKEPWVFLSSAEDDIVQKLSELSTLSDIAQQIFVGLQTSADPVYIVEGKEKDSILEIKSKKLNKNYVVEKEMFKEILTGRDIKRWKTNWRDMWLFFPYKVSKDSAELIEEDEMKKNYPKTWQYLLDHKKFLDEREGGSWKDRENWHAYVYEKNLDMFSKPKIMTGVLANKCSFTVDPEGKFYFVGGGNAGGYGVAMKDDSEVSMEYLVGLLNSSFLDWKVRKKTSKFHGGFFSYAKRFIGDLPIQKPNETNQKVIQDIEKLVKDILSNKNESSKLYKIWEHWAEQMKDAEYSLLDILKSEEDNIKEGELDYLWFENVSFFVSKKNEILDKEFDWFKIRGDYEKSSIEIIGVSDEGEESLFEFVLKNSKTLDHFYISLVITSESRAKINTLGQLFEKTQIPVLRPNSSQKTPNLMVKVYDEFSKVSSSKTDSLVKMENGIEDAEAQIDALVFKLYGLEKNEMNSILDSLSLPPSYQSRVNDYF